jgi:hypothetical protein
MNDLYKNPKQSGIEAFKNGKKESDNPIDRRTHANENLLWSLGWLAEATKCKGIEIEPNVYSGCRGLSDCPICNGKGE